MQSKKVKISDVKVNPNNPRIIKDDKFKKLVQSVRDFPEMLDIRPIVVNADMVVLGGNMRLKACKEAGLKEVPIIIANNLTEEQQREFLIKDNVSGGEWDWELLANEWDAIELENWGLDIPEMLEGVSPEEGEDNIPEVNAISEIGDIYELNNHRVNCGSSCISTDIDKLMNGKKADLIFTDPPYDLQDEYSTIIISHAKDDCHVFIMNSDKLLIDNIQNNKEFFRKMFYVDFRQARLVSNNQPMTRVDPIAEFLKGKGKFNNLRDGFSTLIECAKIHNNNEAQNHGFNQAKKVYINEFEPKHVEYSLAAPFGSYIPAIFILLFNQCNILATNNLHKYFMIYFFSVSFYFEKFFMFNHVVYPAFYDNIVTFI